MFYFYYFLIIITTLFIITKWKEDVGGVIWNIIGKYEKLRNRINRPMRWHGVSVKKFFFFMYSFD